MIVGPAYARRAAQMDEGAGGTAQATSVRIVDCDVHVSPRGGIRSLLPYMTQAWQKQFESIARLKRDAKRHPFRYPNPSGSILRMDAVPPQGGEPGSDPEFLRTDLLERWKIGHALLVPVEWVNAWTDPRLAAAYLSAVNDHFVQEWLPVDPAYTLALCVSPHDPESAAAEIRRHAGTKRVAAVFLPLVNTLLGRERFYPIYEAAQEAALPIITHPTGAEGTYVGAAEISGGIPSTYAERNVSNASIAMSNVCSLVYEGVFERFPRLTVVFIEWGFTWVPSLVWRMDKKWRELRVEIPWVRRPPSEYVFERIRFTTQPVDGPERADLFLPVLEAMRASETLLFSSDYPHWDNDDPFRVLTQLPGDLRARIYAENALATFGHRF
jgi:predicted TIM-barrel fold metal-dependent hydrolase